MAVPLNLEITIPFDGNGFVKITVHVDDVAVLSATDQQFVISLLDRVHAFTGDLLMAQQHREDT